MSAVFVIHERLVSLDTYQWHTRDAMLASCSILNGGEFP